MRIYEIINEVIAPVQPVAPAGDNIDTDIAQQPQQTNEPTPMQIATALKKVAGGTPVGPTGNPGIDNILFTVGGLTKKVGGITNAVGRGLNAIGSAFANNTTLQRTKFKPIRSGGDIAKGIPQNPDDPKKISVGQQNATGVNRVPMTQIDNNQLAELFKKAAGDKPTNPTNNEGIDYILIRAGLIQQ